MSADNQQERLDSYISGFVDGEGSFHIAIQKSKNVKLGYQIVPEFHVSQNFDYSNTLEFIKKRLDCGYIKPNHKKNLRDKSYVFVVRNQDDLLNKIIPFFESNELLSPKKFDFEKFAYIVRAMRNRLHLTKEGFLKLLKIAYSMNRNGSYRKRNIEEIIRDLGIPNDYTLDPQKWNDIV